MSTHTGRARIEVDDEPEEGEIQDDEGSLEDVSSEDEVPSMTKRKERCVYPSGFVTVRRQFVKKERPTVSCKSRCEMRLRSSDKSELNLKIPETRAKSGCRTTRLQGDYYETPQRHKSLNDHGPKVSGKIHEKENKAKESKNARKRKLSFHGAGSDTRIAYNSSEHTEPYLASSTSKGQGHKGDTKEKHRKKRKDRCNKFCNPLICPRQLKIRRKRNYVEECVKSGGESREEPASLKGIEIGKEIPRPPSSSSDIQVLEVPVVVPEVITIGDSDDDCDVSMKKEKDNLKDMNVLDASQKDGNKCLLQLPAGPGIIHEQKIIEEDAEDPDNNLKLLREAALKSSKPESVNIARDDEVLQLRLEALRSAIIRKYEDRKKRGITLPKPNRNAGEEPVMSISPLGSSDSSSSASSFVCANDNGDRNIYSPFVFSISTNHNGASDPTNDNVDKITTIDMELAESDEEKEQICTVVQDGTYHNTIMENAESDCNSYKGDNELDIQSGGVDIVPVDEILASVSLHDFPSPTSPVQTINAPLGYLIGDQEGELLPVSESEFHEIQSPLQSLFDSQVEFIQNNGECAKYKELGRNDSVFHDQRHSDLLNCEKDHDDILESSLNDQISNNFSHPLEIGDNCNLENVNSKNYELDAISNKSDNSYLSAIDMELNLETMIVLDEVGRSSDDGKSECSVGEVLNLEKSSPCEDFEKTSDFVNVSELNGGNSAVDLGRLICTSRSSIESNPIHSDKLETSEDNTDIFKDNSSAELLNSTPNSRNPVDKEVHTHSDNSGAHVANPKTHDVPDLTLKTILSDATVLSILPPGVNIEELSRLNICDKDASVSVCKTLNLSCSNSMNAVEMKCTEISSQANGSVDAVDNQSNNVFSNINKGSLSSLADNEEREGESISQPTSTPTCEKIIDCSPHDTDSVHKMSEHENAFHSSEGDQQQTNNSCNLDNVRTICEKNVNNKQSNSNEDDETVLRDNLLAMLKKQTEQSTRGKSEYDHPGQGPADTVVHKSLNKPDCSTKNTPSVALHTPSCGSTSISSCSKKYDKNALLKQVSSSPSTPRMQQSLRSLAKHVIYPQSLNKRGAKRGNKVRGHEVKVPHRFNVNVPKLVIHLGEDSDSGEDEPVKCDSVTSENGDVPSSESRDNLSISKVVPPDFEKKLDLLLKQARFQQETSTKDDKEISLKTDLSVSCLNTSIQLTSRSSNVGKNNNSIITGSRENAKTKTVFVSKASPSVVQSIANLRAKNVSSPLSRNKILSGGNRDVTKTSIGSKTSIRAVGANKKEIHGRIKYTNANTNSSSSISSAVDIGLLPSSKQKEYIQLKRQLAQLALKDQEVKMKEHVQSVDTSKLSVRNMNISGKEHTTKLPVNVGVINSTIKNNIGKSVEKSLLIRKFYRKAQGGSVILGNDVGKSKRVVRPISTSYSSPNQLRNRLTVTASNRVGGTSSEVSLLSRRVSCMPQKRFVTTKENSDKKSSPDIQVITCNDNVLTDEKQRKLVNHTLIRSAECASKLKGSLLPGKITKINDVQKTQISGSLSEPDSIIQKKFVEKSSVKRKASLSDLEMSSGTKVVIQESRTKEIASDLAVALSQIVAGVQEHTSTSRLGDDVQKSFGRQIILPRRKRCNSEQSGVTVRRKSVVSDSINEQIDHGDSQSRMDGREFEFINRHLAESLYCTESKLISKRYQVLQEIASVQVNLHEIGKVSELKEQVIEDIQRLQNEKARAESRLRKQEELLEVLYKEVEKAKRDILKGQSETLLLSVECEEMGCKLHGSNYSVPNTCTELIRNGMATISKAMQLLKEGKGAVGSDHNKPSFSSSGEALPVIEVIETTETDKNNFQENIRSMNSEDTIKQSASSYLSPLDAIRTATEPSNDSQAVLCPYHIMGSCKDKECSYLH